MDKHDIRALANECYPDITTPVATTHEQRTSLFSKWKQSDQGVSWGEFARSVQPTFGCDDAVTVRWSGMWLCIETDGYCHS